MKKSIKVLTPIDKGTPIGLRKTIRKNGKLYAITTIRGRYEPIGLRRIYHG